MDMAVKRANRRECDLSHLDITAFGARYFTSIDTKLARQARALLKNGDHASLIELDVDAAVYSNADLFARDLQTVSLMSKYPKLNLGIDTAEVAYRAFKDGERQCKTTNSRLSARFDTPTTGVSGDSLIEAARYKISKLLGDFNWDCIEPFFGFSSGSSTRLRKKHGDAYYKFQGKPEVTSDCALLACCAIERIPSWGRRIRADFGLDPVNWVTIVKGNHVTTVPKNAKTDRVIAKEPDLNMFLQKGIGGFIRQRLKLVGIDLDDQSKNQRLALEGSLTNRLATIDLKAASDTVSIAIVERLLDPLWYRALDMLRCRFGTLPSGEVIHYQKFSSMGNGFTFELETLIFWALSSSVVDFYEGEHRVAVYGDDIIVPSAAAGFVIELLDYCGFKTNEKKTHLDGPYRESCGNHYFNGHDVTPFFIRKPIITILGVYWLANSLRRWASRLTPGFADPRYFKVWRSVVDSVGPRDVRWIPDGAGDQGFIGTFAECLPRRKHGLWEVEAKCAVVGKKLRLTLPVAITRALALMGRDRTAGSAGEPSHDGDPNWVIVKDGQLESIQTELNKRKIIDVTMKFLLWTDAPSWCN